MIVGEPTVFAIESKITQAYELPGLRGLGLFAIHLKSRRFGIYEPDATMLAVSFDAVEKRIHGRGGHTAIFSNETVPGNIVDAFRQACYGDEPAQDYFGMATADFVSIVSSMNIQWAPDGDEAFDDGSYVLQFDVEDRVRLIGFKSRAFESRCDRGWDPTTLAEVWIASDDFYTVLSHWRDLFLDEWSSLLKTAD